MGQTVWGVFATKEWESFALFVDAIGKAGIEWKEVEEDGIQLKDGRLGADGRMRFEVRLPDAKEVDTLVQKAKFEDFPKMERSNALYLPKYLELVKRLLSMKVDDKIKNQIEDLIYLSGSAKLINFNKNCSIYTVIVYGSN